MYFAPKQCQCGFIGTSRLFGAKFRVSFVAPCGARELHRDLTPFPTAASVIHKSRFALVSLLLLCQHKSTIGASVIHVKSTVQKKHRDNMYDNKARSSVFALIRARERGTSPHQISSLHTHTQNASEPANTRVLIIKTANLAKKKV